MSKHLVLSTAPDYSPAPWLVQQVQESWYLCDVFEAPNLKKASAVDDFSSVSETVPTWWCSDQGDASKKRPHIVALAHVAASRWWII